jgi:hypothetical protein
MASSLELTRVEFDVLSCLLEQPGRVYSRMELIGRVWGDGFAITDRTIDSHVKALRKKVAEAGAEPGLIETVRGVGYRVTDAPSGFERTVIRLIVVALASVGLMLFVAFVVSRLLRTRTRGMSIRMQIFLALAVIVGAFAFGLGLMVVDRIEARAVRIASQAAAGRSRRPRRHDGGRARPHRRRASADLASSARARARARRGLCGLLLTRRRRRALVPGASRKRTERGVVSVDAPIRVHGVHESAPCAS